MTLADRIESTGETVVAVVGLAKNCGKTTVVNHLIRDWTRRDERLGITSIGRDGEQVDVVTRLPKPRVLLGPGVLAVTADGSLAESPVPARVLLRTGMPTALGELVLVETQGTGPIELSGPSTVEQMRSAISLLGKAGAQRVIVDGALDRLCCGAPSVCGAMVLSAGAVLGGTVESVAAKVGRQIALFGLPELHGDGAELVREIARTRGRKGAAISSDGTVSDLDGSAVTCPDLTSLAGRECHWLWAGGGLTDRIAAHILSSQATREIVVEDATRVFLSPFMTDRLRIAGVEIRVLSAVRLAALTTNPVRPGCAPLDPEDLLDAVAAAAPGFAVYDVVSGLSRLPMGGLGEVPCRRLAS